MAAKEASKAARRQRRTERREGGTECVRDGIGAEAGMGWTEGKDGVDSSGGQGLG